MIYFIFEMAASVIECIIYFLFLIYSLGLKTNPIWAKALGIGLFFTIEMINIVYWDNNNNLLHSELLYVFFYLFILFLFSHFMLKDGWIRKIRLILTGIIIIFIINGIITIITSMVLKNQYAETLLMRNPVRIFLLAVSKFAFAFICYLIGKIEHQKRLILMPAQGMFLILAFLITITMGVSVEKMLLDRMLSLKYISIIIVCISVIDLLFFFIMIQFTRQNSTELERATLQTRLIDDEVKLHESLQWSQSINTLRHDLNNHLMVIANYIEENDSQKALSYIYRITETGSKMPNYIETNQPTINAIVSLKSMTCKDKNIRLKCYIQDELPEFDDIAFNTIFSNIIDNAIEAEINEDSKEIRLAIERLGSFLRITIQNRIHYKVLVNGKLPATSKAESANHGLGFISVYNMVNKLHGSIDFYEKDNWFIVDVLIPFIDSSCN